MRLLIVRHAQSQNNAGVEPRLSDPALTDVGEQQAEKFASHDGLLQQIDQLYVSPMRRTLLTAAPVAAAAGIQARVFTGLHEWGGIWEERDGAPAHLPGLTRIEMQEIIPELFMPDEVSDSGWWQGDLDTTRFEAMLEMSRRNARQFLNYLHDVYPSGTTVAVVTHGGFGSNLMESALGIEHHPERVRFLQNNTGHALIEFDDDHALMRWHNRIDHLPDNLITM